ncbi:5-formyltetrahydrofolate cyclo-ligase [Sabulicella glaciei]|uniref:5-formyltetrahydrofolate cyclo-ligase n=1 Tax=Sabulicella glaciei TaxID=2984948 RepID=A0ABT3P0B0_9PROT|nr:5-formyltetrahydrofolate cyclo-ligase [Roseococcus sp. MDT2-1-1]MCW8087850.1 5-formyltetrahydrofolate cyclo-ligase [Roseococcus sp. MDT2-1-1]
MPCWEDVRTWRRAERERLISRRPLVPRDLREARDGIITDHLLSLMIAATESAPRVLGFYWPFKGEFDPRPLVRMLHRRCIRLALPVVVERGRPVIFREWQPGATMVPDLWGIPVPARGEILLPDVLLVPLVGFDGCGHRLGYGGGYYDRTLADMTPKPFAIGVGFEMSRLGTIYPQPHDVPMDLIVTERGTDCARPVTSPATKEKTPCAVGK